MSQAAEETSPPLDWIILKLVQICNLNCTYCYVYNRGDESWRSRPKFISAEIIDAVSYRIKEHCSDHNLSRFTVELHGGEPLLLGKQRFRSFVERIRDVCDPVHIEFILQTNGLLLDTEWLDVFSDLGISFGISIDGPPEYHDRYRVYRDGSGSSQKLLAKIAHLREAHPNFETLFGGVLCVVNPDIHGGEAVEWFVANGFTTFEFLLPDATYVNPPSPWQGPAPYRRFLIEAFEAWYALGKDAPNIRMFETMLAGFLGRKPTLDALGGDIRRLCVVESDGGIGVSDVLRICSDYAYDSLNVREHRLDSHAAHYRVAQIQKACGTCQSCPFFTSCGGGYLPHRYDGESFDNPSIYCDALFGVLKAMHDRLRRDVPEEYWEDPPVVGETRLEVTLREDANRIASVLKANAWGATNV